jgi:hypothetical protein
MPRVNCSKAEYGNPGTGCQPKSLSVGFAKDGYVWYSPKEGKGQRSKEKGEANGKQEGRSEESEFSRSRRKPNPASRFSLYLTLSALASHGQGRQEPIL